LSWLIPSYPLNHIRIKIKILGISEAKHKVLKNISRHVFKPWALALNYFQATPNQ
jgi:hypothetical protein